MFLPSCVRPADILLSVLYIFLNSSCPHSTRYVTFFQLLLLYPGAGPCSVWVRREPRFLALPDLRQAGAVPVLQRPAFCLPGVRQAQLSEPAAHTGQHQPLPGRPEAGAGAAGLGAAGIHLPYGLPLSDAALSLLYAPIHLPAASCPVPAVSGGIPAGQPAGNAGDPAAVDHLRPHEQRTNSGKQPAHRARYHVSKFPALWPVGVSLAALAVCGDKKSRALHRRGPRGGYGAVTPILPQGMPIHNGLESGGYR